MGKKLGLKIKQLRSEYALISGKKLTQKDLSDMLGISRSYLGDIESGRTNASDELIGKISKIFNIDIEELIKYKKYDESLNLDINTVFSGPGKLIDDKQNTKLSKEEVKLLENYNKSNNEGKKMIISYSDYVSKNHVSVETEISASIDNSMPIAAHANEKATEEDIKHDMDIMNDDSQW